MTKEIELTLGLVTLVDDEDFDYLNQWNWYSTIGSEGVSYYAAHTEGGRKNKKNILMHRVIMNTPKGMRCDHRNHDTLDNRKHNLRNATPSQNCMNSKTRKDNRLGEKCIRIVNGDKYNVRITKDRIVVFDRCFSDLDVAKYVRDSKLKEIHGEFAYLGESQ